MVRKMRDLYLYLKKDEITKFCERVDMPAEATKIVCDLIDSFDFSAIAPYYHMLFSVKTGNDAVNEINTILENEEKKGFVWLTVYLAAVLEAKTTYDALGIDDKIFYDTMAIFSRFVNEHKESFGVYGYDRQKWNFRQISCTLFRIDELEYEMCEFANEDAVINGETVIAKGENTISIHIPSDARLNPENNKTSLKNAMKFLEKHFPSFEYRMMYCQSWIISPNLRDVLNENSNIINFLENFEIYKVDPDQESYKIWVFKNEKLTIDQFPQNTSLQRNITKHLRQGGKIGSACGVIRKTSIQSL